MWTSPIRAVLRLRGVRCNSSSALAAWRASLETSKLRSKDYITPSHVQALVSTLETRDDPPAQDWEKGQPFPPGWTLSFPLETMAPTSELNVVDATEITAHHPPGDTGLIERMWAGGEFTFNRDLHVGDEVITESTVEKVKDFTGRDGRQGLFVTQRREMRSADAREEEPAVVEKRIYLHRSATVAAAQPKPKASTPRESDFAAPSLLTDVHLVRFSLITFNSHRIHWDADYCKNVEKRDGLVVHGPLTALLLLNTFRHAVPSGHRVHTFSYRATAPLTVNTPVQYKGKWSKDDSGTCELWCEGEDGTIYMSGEGRMTSV